jgi:hypothetical protein
MMKRPKQRLKNRTANAKLPTGSFLMRKEEPLVTEGRYLPKEIPLPIG